MQQRAMGRNREIAALLLVPLMACGGDESLPDPEAIHPLTRSWERALPLQKVPQDLKTLRAAECGECHEEIYAEWKGSVHAQALADPQFQAEWKKDGYLFVCRNCHTPLQNQQETVVRGLIGGDYHRPAEVPNPDFDPVLKEEAITCAVCHVRDGFVIGPYGDAGAPHPIKKDLRLLSAQACLDCHNAKGVLSAALVCTFATGDEWQASPYPQQGQDCVTCHMPQVQRPNAADEPVRASNLHTWAGSGIPKFPGQEGLGQRGFVGGLEIQVSLSKEFYQAGEAVYAAVSIGNQRAGHELPTGDVERFVSVDMQVIGPAGKVLQARQERLGEVWEWWPEARQVADNSFKPLERRTYDLSCEIPEDMTEATLKVVVTNHRMTEENAEAMGLLGQYPLASEIFRAEYPLLKPPGEKP
jgi:hypothetical protein